MEVIVVLVLIVLFIVIVTGNNRLQSQVRNLQQEMTVLQKQLQQLLSRQEAAKKEESIATRPVSPDIQRWEPKATQVTEEQQVQKPLPESPKPAPAPVPIPKPVQSPPIPVSLPTVPQPPPRPTFFELNPDLEKFIGENLVPKIGIAILVIAIGFFVKYAIDQDWIGPAGRVGIGLLCGGILVGIAHRLQRSYKAFGSVLVGGGLAVFYFSIALAYKDYGLFSQPVAFIIMVVITVFAILLALLYDRQEVAIIALVGGFAVPFLVSNGSGNYVTLFTYLLLLNAGLLVIAYRKAWRLLNIIAFAATVILYWGWVASLPASTRNSTYLGGFLFATAFYLLFLAINLAHNIREQKKFIASDFGILLANNCLYFSAGIFLLFAAGEGQYKGLFCAALGVLNFVLAAVLIRRRNIDPTILYLLVGVTLTFVSLTAPLQLEGHSITLFWAAESVVLLWLFQKSRIRILQWGLLAVWLCSIVSLLMDWSAVYNNSQAGTSYLTVLANKGFMTTLFVAAANALLYRLMLRNTDEAPFPVFEKQIILRILGAAALLFLFAAGALEIEYQFSHRYAGAGLGGLYLLLYTNVFALLLYELSLRNMIRLHWLINTLLLGLCLFLYLIAVSHAYDTNNTMLITGLYRLHFMAHWISMLLTAVIFCVLVQSLRVREDAAAYRTAITWFGAAFAVVFVSVETALLTNAIAYTNPQSLDQIGRNYVRVGLPIIWGLCSFALMWLGMRHKYRMLRIASLTLFSITLLKLFLFDIRDVPIAGKIAAFFSLGVLLLVVSFMYQRLKRLIIEDERKANEA